MDYHVRKRGGWWVVTREYGPPVDQHNSWEEAMASAWGWVIADDLAKGEDMVNG